MQPLSLEPAMDELLDKLIPGSLEKLEGATAEQIEKIERIAGRPLPNFYRWFLSRMGRSMGPFTNPGLDYSASTIIDCYAEELFPPDQRFLMIGYETDEMMPLHLLYDFDYPARDDARVVTMEALDTEMYIRFDTFREMIAWGEFLRLRVRRTPQQCRGLFEDPGEDVLMQLQPAMARLGFEAPAPVPTGPRCALYEAAAASMVTSATPDDAPRIHIFRIGADNAGTIRRVLGEIAAETALEVKIKEWTPPLV